eukprot:7909845-Pyramimonas_sp.AAC.1
MSSTSSMSSSIYTGIRSTRARHVPPSADRGICPFRLCAHISRIFEVVCANICGVGLGHGVGGQNRPSVLVAPI